jgi:rhomboid protease GluP
VFLSVGASGAIFGVIAAVFILVIVQGGRWESISLPRMLLMIVYSLYSGFVSENVNNAGHIGGFIVGLVIMVLYYIIERLQKKKEVSHEN